MSTRVLVLFSILEGETPVLPSGVRLATGFVCVAFVMWRTLLLHLVTEWFYDEKVLWVVRCIFCIYEMGRVLFLHKFIHCIDSVSPGFARLTIPAFLW